MKPLGQTKVRSQKHGHSCPICVPVAGRRGIREMIRIRCRDFNIMKIGRGRAKNHLLRLVANESKMDDAA